MNINRRIANGIKKVHSLVDARAEEVRSLMTLEVCDAYDQIKERFNTAARSIGQHRRYRNQGDSNARS